MEFQNVTDDFRSQIKFYRILCIGLVSAIGLLAVVVPSSMKSGPYVVQDSESLYSVSRSQPWKLTVSRVEGFLKLYLTARFDWSQENTVQRKELLKTILSEQSFLRMKDSILALEALTRNQGGRVFYVLEGYRFSNQQRVVEAQISRIVRVGATGVVTPLLVRFEFTEKTVSEQNPYGLQITSIEETEVRPASGGKSS